MFFLIISELWPLISFHLGWNRALGNITGSIVNVDELKVHSNEDGQLDKTRTDAYLHFVNSKDNSIMEVDAVLRLIDANVESLDQLFKVHLISNFLAGSLNHQIRFRITMSWIHPLLNLLAMHWLAFRKTFLFYGQVERPSSWPWFCSWSWDFVFHSVLFWCENWKLLLPQLSDPSPMSPVLQPKYQILISTLLKDLIPSGGENLNLIGSNTMTFTGIQFSCLGYSQLNIIWWF